jgi:hypothetical protein
MSESFRLVKNIEREIGNQGSLTREEGSAEHRVTGGSPPGRGDRRRGRKPPETERGSGQRGEMEPGLGLGQGKIF